MTAAQKELAMLWMLLSANPNRSPASGQTGAQIFNGITTAVQTALGNGSWNWPGFGSANASNLVNAAVQREQTAITGGTLRPYGSVLLDFRAAAGSAPPWSTGNDHPSPAELVAALGIQ